jgi:hypothetical protein
VEHTCQQCGTTVEDGRPFCPQCRAPQIHVQVAVPDPPAARNFNAAGDESSDGDSRTSLSGRHVLSANSMDSRIAVRAAIKAGLLGVFIGGIPFIGLVLTGALAVFFYRRKSGFAPPAILGARLGGAAGIIVFGIGALLAVAVIALHAQQQCIDMTMATLQKLGMNTADPKIQASFREAFTLSGQVIYFLVAVVFTSVGGALASLLLGPRDPRQ